MSPRLSLPWQRRDVAELSAHVSLLESRLAIYERALGAAFEAADRPDPFASPALPLRHLRLVPGGRRDRARRRPTVGPSSGSGSSGTATSQLTEVAEELEAQEMPEAA
jgi:hypothetical protein